MTVKELIEMLEGFDPSLTVTVDGYEGGVTERIDIEPMLVVCNVNDESWMGEHEDARYAYKSGPTKNVINIGR